MTLSRRHFLAGAAACGAGLLWQGTATAQNATPPVCVFSKHLLFIKEYATLAKTAKSLGLDGLDLAVRKGGHVEPENVAADLPKCVDAVRAEGLDVFMITTALKRADDADARPILEAASKLGIRYARIGGHQYSKDGDITEELKGFTDDMRGLAALLASNKMAGGYHNHSGGTNVGAPMWDLHAMFSAIDNPSLGSNFDVGHATVEGGLGAWRLNARLLAPYVKMTAVKDFVWEDGKVRWVRLGEGQVTVPEFFSIFKAAGFSGPASLHVEYKLPSDDAMLEEIRVSALRLREDLKKAGYAGA